MSGYWCAALKDDVLKAALGSTDVARVVTGKFYCQISDKGRTALQQSLRLSLAIRARKPAFDWFVEPNPLGDDADRRVRLVIDALMAYDQT